MITIDDLRQEIANLEQQKAQAANLYQQAEGALALARAMLARLDGNILTEKEFAEAIAGPGAQSEVIPHASPSKS